MCALEKLVEHTKSVERLVLNVVTSGKKYGLETLVAFEFN